LGRSPNDFQREVMALYYSLPIYRDVYSLLLKIFEVTKEFPREYKYTLGQDMKRDAMKLVQGIYRANKALDKQESIEALQDDFEIVKLQIRLCADLKVIGLGRQSQLAVLTDAIGRQLSGWSNSLQHRQ